MKNKKRLFLKLAAGFAVAAVVFFIGGTYALKKYLPPEKVRALILEHAHKLLNREVEVGNVSLTLLKGLEIESLRVSEFPDFTKGEFAGLRSFKLKISLAPLLSGRIVVDRIVLEGLSLNVSRSTAGVFNFSDLLGSSATAKPGVPAGALALPMVLSVSEAVLSDFRLTYRDALTGDSLKVTDLDAVIEDFDLKKPFDAQAGFKVDAKVGGRPVVASVEFEGEVALADFDLSRIAVDMESFTAESRGITVKASGKASNLNAPSASGKASFEHGGEEFFTVTVSSATLSLGETPTLYADFEAFTPGFDSAILKPFGVPALPVPGGRAAGVINWDGKRLLVDGLKVESPGITLEASGEVADPLGEKPKVLGRFSARFDLPAIDLKSLSLEGFIKGIPPITLPAVKGEVSGSLSGETAKLKTLSIKSEFGTVTASGEVRKLGSPNPLGDFEAALDLKIPKIHTKDLPVKDLPPFLLPSAEVRGKVRLKGDTAFLEGLEVKTEFGGVMMTGSVRRVLSKNPQPNLSVIMSFKTPEIKSRDIPYPGIPSGLVIPAAAIMGEALIHRDLVLKNFKVKTKFGRIGLSGSVLDVMGPKPSMNLTARFFLDLPEIKTQDLPIKDLPPMTLPAAKVRGSATFKGEDLFLKSLSLTSKLGRISLTGSIKKVLADNRVIGLTANLALDLPETKTQDLPIKDLPPLTLPAAKVGGSLTFRGEDLILRGITVRSKLGHLNLSGSVKKILSKEPEPKLVISGKLDLPAFKSADVPVEGMPAGLSIPKSRIEFSLTGNMKALVLKNLRIVMGSTDISVSGKVRNVKAAVGPPLNHEKLVVDVLVKCRKFVLDEITAISPLTREMELSGSGFFAAAVGGRLDKPVLSGKLRFRDIGMKIYGLDLEDFSGDVTFDKKRFDIPKLKGKIDGGSLAMDLTVEDYAAHPRVDLEATLDRFDMGKFLKAKNEFLASRKKSDASPLKEDSEAVNIPAFDAKGKFEVARLIHPNAEGRNLFMRWDLTDITPDLKKLDGTANMKILGGRFTDLLKLARREKMIKVLLLPVMIVQKVKLTPNLNELIFTEVVGDYTFKKGIMTLHDSHIYNERVKVRRDGTVDYTKKKYDLIISAKGTIDLPKEEVDLVVEGKLGAFGSVKRVTGSIDDPKIGRYRGRQQR